MARTGKEEFVPLTYKFLPCKQKKQLLTAEITETSWKNSRVLCGLGDLCGEEFLVAVMLRRVFRGCFI